MKVNFNTIFGIVTSVLAAAGAVVNVIATLKSSQDGVTDSYDRENGSPKKKYKVFCNGYDEGTFDSEEDAQEYIGYLRGCAAVGADTLHLNNPGDYDEHDYGDNHFEIVER